MKTHPTMTPSWPQATAAKAAYDAVRKNSKSTDQQRKAAHAAYQAAMRKCLQEAGLVR